MEDFDVGQMIGPSAVIAGGRIELDEAIRITEEQFPGRSFCSGQLIPDTALSFFSA